MKETNGSDVGLSGIESSAKTFTKSTSECMVSITLTIDLGFPNILASFGNASMCEWCINHSGYVMVSERCLRGGICEIRYVYVLKFTVDSSDPFDRRQ